MLQADECIHAENSAQIQTKCNPPSLMNSEHLRAAATKS